MRPRHVIAITSVALTIGTIGAALIARTPAIIDPRPGIDWPSFRGIEASGVGDGFSTATTWDVPKGVGVKWKVPIAGLGHSSPIIWGDRLCLTTAISGKKDA